MGLKSRPQSKYQAKHHGLTLLTERKVSLSLIGQSRGNTCFLFFTKMSHVLAVALGNTRLM